MTFTLKKISYICLAFITLLPVLSFFPKTAGAATCTISEARFFNHSSNAGNLDLLNSSDQGATLRITTNGECAGWQATLDLEEIDRMINDLIQSNFTFNLAAGTTTNVELTVGEEECDLESTPDCSVGGTIKPFRVLPSGQPSYGLEYKFSDLSKTLNYNCKASNSCANAIPWKITSQTSTPGAIPPSTPPATPNTTVVTPSADPAGVDVNCTGKPSCYTLDSGLAEILKTKTIDTSSLGGFINSIIAFAIGVAGVFTVGAIMYDGFTYWKAGGDTIKISRVKGRIWKRLLGLLLLFTIYTILRTINPDLLNLTPRIDLLKLSIDDKIALSAEGVDVTDQKNAPTKKEATDAINKYKTKLEYLEKEYIPARDRTLPNVSKGIRLAITTHAQQEGFYPGSISYRTNNPGNIGNRDDGGSVTYPTLADGIKKQADFFTSIASNNEPNYKLGSKKKSPAATYNGVTYPGIDFTYNGSLDQYLKIYALGARKSSSYVNLFINYFAKNGVTITPQTTLAQIAAIR